MKWIYRLLAIGITICIVLIHDSKAQSPSPQLSLDVEVNEILANSQSIDIQSLIANNGRGPNLFRMYLRNESSDYANNLFFNIIIESDNIGRIAEITQLSSRPFSLSPNQEVIVTNNNIGDGLPGVEEVIQFDGEFTEAGTEFVNNLKGSTRLPADQYRIRIEIYQRSTGGDPLVSTMQEIGTSIVEDTRDFYLLSPGDEIGSEAIISNSYPNFQWQGATGTNYRLIVVESKENDSPQSLLDGAMSTNPTKTVSSSGTGSLLDYEMLDVEISQSNYQYPNTGVQNLEPGNQYYWRVIALLNTSSGDESRQSEVWSFTLNDNSESRVTRGSGEFSQALKRVLGEQFEEIAREGYSFESIEIDGQTFQGGQALQKLMELQQQSENGDISIVIEQ